MIEMSRRELLRRAGAVGAAAMAAGGRGLRAADAARPVVPRIKLGRGEFSRIWLDYLPFRGGGHNRYLVCKAMYEYYQVDENLARACAEAAGCGVDSALVCTGGTLGATVDVHLRLGKLLKKGGKVNKLIYEVSVKNVGLENAAQHVGEIEDLASYFIEPGDSDGLLTGQFERLQKLLKIIRDSGKVVGAATRSAKLLGQYDKYRRKGLLEIDYYVLTVCTSDDYPAEARKKAFEALAGVELPVVLRRIMPADIKAADARPIIAEALRHMAPKDALSLGVYPKDDPDQIKRYCAWVAELSKQRGGSGAN